ncbi:MAG TPA: Asp-tRNA(Asn)/Glu-tRNA(Gln) amidotransferase subunit GatA, partial [Saprospiraceae bacterium]|nr:Asp-tRNA(Asn)/Glu-tRNA(Gln) amidotransferase subunit GatA [Saprospiraceae bacterium]
MHKKSTYNIPFQTIPSVQEALRQKRISCEQLLTDYLSQIEKTRHLNAYVEVFATEALQKAKSIDEKLKSNQPLGKLYGVVLSIKDNISYEGHQLSAGSKILQGYQALFSATAIRRLLDEDAIIIGRTNCDEFGMGSSNENSFYGAVKNGFDESLISGGSSGGAAVSVQTGTCLAALGTDTGGSVRQPAAFCGLYGFKPAYGRVSRHGLVAYGSSFDQLGIIAHTPEVIGDLMQIIAGPDEYDATCLQTPPPDYHTPPKNAHWKVAYFDGILDHQGMHPEIKTAFSDYLEDLAVKGHEVTRVPFEYLDYLIPTYYILTTAEASTNLSRYDGIRYGFRAGQVDNLEETYTKTRTEGFGQEVKRRILLGTYVLSAGYYDAYFAQAQKSRRLIQDKLYAILAENDFLILPVTANYPRKIGTNPSPVEEYL